MIKELKSEKGFSLFEIIIVILLISIMFVFVTPGFQKYIEESDLSGISKKIANTVKDLKYNSLRYQKTYYLNYESDKQTLWTSYEGISLSDEDVAKKNGFTIDEDISLEFITETKLKSVGFYPGGYSDIATIKISDGSQQISILIKPLILSPEIK